MPPDMKPALRLPDHCWVFWSRVRIGIPVLYRSPGVTRVSPSISSACISPISSGAGPSSNSTLTMFRNGSGLLRDRGPATGSGFRRIPKCGCAHGGGLVRAIPRIIGGLKLLSLSHPIERLADIGQHAISCDRLVGILDGVEHIDDIFTLEVIDRLETISAYVTSGQRFMVLALRRFFSTCRVMKRSRTG